MPRDSKEGLLRLVVCMGLLLSCCCCQAPPPRRLRKLNLEEEQKWTVQVAVGRHTLQCRRYYYKRYISTSVVLEMCKCLYDGI